MTTQDTNIAVAIAGLGQSNPRRVALLAGEKPTTFGALRYQSICFALHLKKHGVTRNSCVAIDLPDVRNSFPVVLAVGFLGARWVASTIYAYQNKALGITHVVHNGTTRYPAGPAVVRMDDTWQNLPVDQDVSAGINFPGYASSDDAFAIFQSSGSTGTPKFIPVSYRQMHYRLSVSRKFISTSRPIVASMFNPLSSTGCRLRLSTLSAGGALLETPRIEYWRKAGVTMVQGSPAHFAKWFDQHNPPSGRKLPLARLGGGKAQPELISMLRKYFESIRVGFGSTETGTVSDRILLSEDTHDGRLGVIGDHAQVEIVDSQNSPLPTGQEGRVRVRTPGMVQAYLGNLEATSKAFREGWFYPGDIGVLSDQNELVLLRRENDQFSLGGAKLDATTVDEIIQKEAGIRDAISCEVPDKVGVNRLGVVIQTSGTDVKREDLEIQIRRIMHKELGENFLPTHLLFVPVAPRNENGKPMRHRAAEMIQESMGDKE